MGDPERVTYFAATDSRGKRQPFGIKAKDRSRHMYVIGKTGMGKSTLLENMAIQDIQNGEGLAFIDPHGSVAEKLLDYVPKERTSDVLYFAPFDMDYPLAFNIMEDVGYDKRHLVVAGLMSTFKKIWVDVWSSRMEYILENTLFALLEYPGSTLLDVNRMLVQKSFRKQVVENIKDPQVRSFWVDEFATYTDRYTQEATPAIQNKVGQFTSNPLIRNIVGQPKSTFDLRKLMDEGKIVIANLSKGRMGEKNAALLGSMLTVKIYLSAMSRAEESAATLQTLPDFYFYVDEFQSIANESFADILSEARKYKLNLVLAHQYVEQMEEEIRGAVFGNVGTTVVFRVGPFDAETLETIFKPTFIADDLVNLGIYQIYLTLMIDGIGSPPFSAVTLPPIEPPRISHKEQIIEGSRKSYAKPRDQIEKEVQERIKPPEEPQSQQSRAGGQQRDYRSQSRPPRPQQPKQGQQRERREERLPQPSRTRQETQERPSHRQGTPSAVSPSQLKEKVKTASGQEKKESTPAQQRNALRDALAEALTEREQQLKEKPKEAPAEHKEQKSTPAPQPKEEAKVSTGNGEAKVSTGNGEAKVSTGNGEAKVSTGNGEIQTDELKKVLKADEKN